MIILTCFNALDLVQWAAALWGTHTAIKRCNVTRTVNHLEIELHKLTIGQSKYMNHGKTSYEKRVMDFQEETFYWKESITRVTHCRNITKSLLLTNTFFNIIFSFWCELNVKKFKYLNISRISLPIRKVCANNFYFYINILAVPENIKPKRILTVIIFWPHSYGDSYVAAMWITFRKVEGHWLV